MSADVKRLLIVAPHFAPISAPDGQRARMLVPHFAEFGWEVHVLTVEPSAAETPLEPELLETLPPDLPITRVGAWRARSTRRLGLGNIAWRAWNTLRCAGDRLLRQQRFDLVYFSTTQFACLPLGRLWQRRWQVPFVIDLQDPWRSDYRTPAGTRPPGGWKHRFASAQARWLEPWTLRRCAGVLSVSPAYLDRLAQRYAWWNPAHGRVLPMGWSERDFACASALAAKPAIDRSVIRYLGRLGADLQPALDVFLAGFARARAASPGLSTRCEFRGGSYDPNATHCTASDAALRHGVADHVSERSLRIPYLAALAALRSAGGNLILGSDDSGYAPSKIWLILAANRPWLALARRGAVLHRLLQPHTGAGGWLVDPSEPDAVERIAAFCESVGGIPEGSADRAELARFEARELARQHAEFFAKVLVAPR